MDLLTYGLGFAPYSLVTGGMAPAGLAPGVTLSGPSQLLTAGLGFAPFTLITGGLWATHRFAAVYRDRPLLGFIRDSLAATGEFDLVETAGDLEAGRVVAEYTAVASLSLLADEPDFDTLGENLDTTPELDVVMFRLILSVRDEDPDRGKDELSRLKSVARNVINGASFGGVTIPSLTCLGRGEYTPGHGPEYRITIEGQFAYVVEDWANHNEDLLDE